MHATNHTHPYFHEASNEQVAVKQCRIGCIMLVGEARYVETSPINGESCSQ